MFTHPPRSTVCALFLIAASVGVGVCHHKHHSIPNATLLLCMSCEHSFETRSISCATLEQWKEKRNVVHTLVALSALGYKG